jgi:hypothetical protein
MAGQPLTEGWGMDGKKRRCRSTQIIMSPLFLQICKLLANALNFNQIRIYRAAVNIKELKMFEMEIR